jgi:melibiose permease/lactose/raffinose/galactose permease
MEFTLFALTIGAAQILTLALYPVLFKNMPRRKQFPLAVGIVVLGYLGFMLVGTVLPMSMPLLMVFGFILFSGQAIIQLLTYVLLADTVEYGQWKLGTRNESIVFSVRPFIDKLSSAIQIGIFSLIMIVSGLNKYSQQISELESSPALTQEQIIAMGNEVVQTIPRSSTLIMRAGMLILPLVLILLSYIVYRKRYNMTEEKYASIIDELAKRGETQAVAGAEAEEHSEA